MAPRTGSELHAPLFMMSAFRGSRRFFFPSVTRDEERYIHFISISTFNYLPSFVSEVILSDLAPPGRGVSSAQTRHKSEPGRVERRRMSPTCPPACRRSWYKYISREWPPWCFRASVERPRLLDATVSRKVREGDNKLGIEMKVILNSTVAMLLQSGL